MANTQRSGEGRAAPHISPKIQRIAELARSQPQMAFTSISHFIDLDWLREAFHRTRKDGAAGIDGQTAADYESNLDENLRSLLERFRSGNYVAPPVRRVHIPKPGTAKMRPIGIPTFEDKMLQRAVLMLLEPIFEQDFLECSFGFRPGRSAHQALDAVWHATMGVRGGWVLEVDIQNFFDEISKSHLREMVSQRVTDGVLRRQLDKWLNAGVIEAGQWHRPDAGSPQGGVISPMLSNVYLHHVLDVWFEQDVKPRLRDKAVLIRFADDAVMVFGDEHDARRVLDVLPKRFARFGLRLHPEKTRLIDFRKPTDDHRPRQPRHFDLLGFRHFWGRSQTGQPVVKRKTAPSRFTRALRAINEWLREHHHDPINEQHKALCRKVNGHYAYFGILGNSPALARFCFEVGKHWRRWLSRRSWTGRMAWDAFNRVLQRFPLPPPRVVHRHRPAPA